MPLNKKKTQNNQTGSDGEVNRNRGAEMIVWVFQILRTEKKKLLYFFFFDGKFLKKFFFVFFNDRPGLVYLAMGYT